MYVYATSLFSKNILKQLQNHGKVQGEVLIVGSGVIELSAFTIYGIGEHIGTEAFAVISKKTQTAADTALSRIQTLYPRRIRTLERVSRYAAINCPIGQINQGVYALLCHK